ncbi:MAG: ATP-binding protein [Syntrophobacter sp.]
MKRSVRVKSTRCHLVLLSVLALLLCRYDPAYAETWKRPGILIIYGFDRSLPSNTLFFSGITRVLEPYDLNMFDIFQENLDLNRNSSSEYFDSLAAHYTTKYASRKLDAIVTLGAATTDFFISRCSGLSPGTPLVPVFASLNKYPENASRKIIPVVVDMDLRQTIDLILCLQPTLGKMYIVGAKNKNEGVFVHQLERIIPQYRNGPEFVFLAPERYDELLTAVEVLDPSDAVLYIGYLMDGAGNAYAPEFVVGKLSKSAGCPVYGIMGTYLQSGAVGGAMMPFLEPGLVVGDILLGLSGMKHGTVAPGEVHLSPSFQVDERQMTRWGLSEKNLPAGFEVVNRAPSLWRDYRGHVGGALLFFIAQGSLIFWLLIQRRSRMAAERELRGTCRELEENQEELRCARDLQDRALDGLRESEATLQAILASIPVGVLLMDADSGTILTANRSAAELLGIPPEQMAGRPCPGCFESFVREESAGGLQNRNRETSFEDTIAGLDGHEVYVLKTVDRVSLEGKAHLIGCLLDITKRKIAEREARERADQLLHADKMISLGVMAAGITHEINNPNNFISLNAPMLKRAWESVLGILDEYAEKNGDFLVEKTPYSRARKHVPSLLNGIIEGSERIRNIVWDIKEFVSQKPSGAVEEVDINSILRSSLNLLTNKLDKSTKNLVVDYGENIPMVAANGQRVEQVMINLILNAAEALTDETQALNIRSYRDDGGKVVLEVRDGGEGIKPENLGRIFDPFFTTKRETGGTGLGLAISQKIVEAYGGRILISSTAGEGTTAVLELPACSETNRSGS